MPDGSPFRSRQLDYALPDRQGLGSEPAPDDGPLSPTVITIDEDGGVTIGSPAVHSKKDETNPEDFGANLAIQLDGGSSTIGYELIEGIDADIASRKGFIDQYTQSMDLLGLTIEEQAQGKNGPASRIGHPLLLGAVVKAQAAASAELLPSGGPCKASSRYGDDAQTDELAQAFESDMNWYLTQGAPEYYPDMDRGIFGLMHGGNLFKKVYRHPLRRRPASDAIALEDLIVSEDATDLDTAIRVTHRSEMVRAQVRRMQLLAKAWADVPLGEPMPNFTAEARKKDEISGTHAMSMRPKDTPYTIYECTTDLCLEDYGLYDAHAPGDLPVAYAVTLEKDTKQILDIRRRWAQDDEMFQRKQKFVHFGMIPALGFLCLGHSHLLGNQTKALRAIWRILVTAGMYSNAPAGIKAKTLRLSTSEINPQPGEWTDVDISGFDKIADAFMALPYKDPSSVFIQLADMIGKESGELASVADMPQGDSRVDIPVGTILAMIEQATQMASAVHKRLYRAQARELTLLKECFAENPDALWKLNKNPARHWQEAAEFADVDLVPASDPNVPSQMHRIMLATAMVTMAGQNPDIYDRVGVHKRAWSSIGVNDADSFLHEPDPNAGGGGKPPPAPPDPLIGQARMIEAQAKMAAAQNNQTDQQRKAATEAIEAKQQAAELAQEGQGRAAELQSERDIEAARLQTERERLQVEQTRASAEHDLATRQAASEHQGRVADAGLGFAQHGLEVAKATAEHGRAMSQQEQDAAQADREHSRAQDEIAIKRKVASRPVPKPAARQAGKRP